MDNKNNDIEGAIQNNTGTKKTLGQKKRKLLWVSIGILIVAVIIVAIIMIIGYCNSQKIELIKATYTGETTSGTEINNANPGITVTGRRKDKEWIELSPNEWKISLPATLEADKTTTVKIVYKDLSCELSVACSDSTIVSIDAYYSGKLDAGTKITNITEGFAAMATYKNGKKIDITDMCIIVDAPIELQADKSSTINVLYEDPVSEKTYKSSFTVKCSTKTVRQISAKYTGNAFVGETLNNQNKAIIVTALFTDGEVAVVDGWTIKDPVTLENSKISKVNISYGGKTTILSVECSEFESDLYCEACEKVTYNQLARTPDDYVGKLVWIDGKISSIEANSTTSSGYIYRIYIGTSKYIRVAFNGSYEDGLLIEDDKVRCYGEYLGLDDSSYDECPRINAKVIKRRY